MYSKDLKVLMSNIEERLKWKEIAFGVCSTLLLGRDVPEGPARLPLEGWRCFMYSHDPNQEVLPGGFKNEIVLSDEFFREVMTHSIPTDREAAKALSSSPAALDLFMWLLYRCFTEKGRERIAIFGDFGLAGQLGSADYARPGKFRERLGRWLDLVRLLRRLARSNHVRWRPYADSGRRGSSVERGVRCPRHW